MPIDNVTLIFAELAVGLLVAVILGRIAQVFRQPLILAYIATGVLISALGLFRLGEQEILPLLASFGVVFLLFLVGLELRLTELKHVGKSALYTGLGQLIFTFVAGFIIVRFFNFSVIEAVYIAIALTFSSTIIVVKLLTEKKDLNSLYGKIVIGFLLVQDAAAILALIFLAGFDPTTGKIISLANFYPIVVKGVIVIGAAVLLAKYILPQFFSYSAASAELLLLSALTFAFIFASFTKLIGFSLEIGAFLAGISLASSPYQLAILSKIRPLRDFFIVIFFIYLGTSMAIGQVGTFVLPIIFLSAFILIGNPLIVLAVMGFLGHRKRTSFLASVTVAQISEFSLIVVALGVKIGHLGSEILSLVAAVGIITIAVSSYMITYSNWLYKKLSGYLDFFERKHVREEARISFTGFANHIILVGAEQVGRDLLDYLAKKVEGKKNIVIIDFNPQVIENLTAVGFNAVLGDISDHELTQELNLPRAKLIISTVPDFEDNQILIKAAKASKFAGPIIVTTYWAKDAVKLYEAGADFVLVPELAGGDKVIRVLQDSWEDLSQLKQEKPKFLQELLDKKPLLALG